MIKHYAAVQEALRKDIERAFGVIQIQFAYIQGRARLMDNNKLNYIMRAIIILHNMIVQDNRESGLKDMFTAAETPADPSQTRRTERIPDLDVDACAEASEASQERLRCFVRQYKKLRDSEAHKTLKNALIKHLWMVKGARKNGQQLDTSEIESDSDD